MRWHGFFFLVKLFLSFCWFLFKLFWSSETNGNFLIVCCPSKSPISIYLPKVLQCYGYIDPYKFPHYTLTICQTNLLQNCSKNVTIWSTPVVYKWIFILDWIKLSNFICPIKTESKIHSGKIIWILCERLDSVVHCTYKINAIELDSWVH